MSAFIAVKEELIIKGALDEGLESCGQGKSSQVQSAGSLSWTHNPWKASFWRTICAFALNLAIVYGVYLTFPEKGFSILAAILLFGMTLTLFVPVRYELTDEGVAVYFLGTRSFRAWSHYRNFYLHKEGVFLTSMPKPSGLDPFRGHFLKYFQNKDEVESFVRAHIKRTEAST